MFEWDHNIPVAHGGPDDWWNLDPKLRADHREKTRRDISVIAKTKRIRQAEAAHAERMAELGKAVAERFVRDAEILRTFRAKRRWPSRSFPKGRKLRQLNQRKE